MLTRAQELFTTLEDRGASEVEHLIAVQASEAYHLDFKKVSPKWPGDRNAVENDLRKELGKDLSGFANSNGGVLIWGVDCNRKAGDVASAKAPFEAFQEFRAVLEGMVSGLTIPTVPDTQLTSFAEDGKPGKGYVALLVPRSEIRPHQSLSDRRYYHRTGNTTKPAEHDFIASLFGRFPQPRLELSVACEAKPWGNKDPFRNPIRMEFALILRNVGSGIARDYFVQVDYQLGPPSMYVRFGAKNQGNWIPSKSDRFQCLTSLPGARLVPWDMAEAELFLDFERPANHEVLVQVRYGCQGAPVSHIVLSASPESIGQLYAQLVDHFYVDRGGRPAPPSNFDQAIRHTFIAAAMSVDTDNAKMD